MPQRFAYSAKGITDRYVKWRPADTFVDAVARHAISNTLCVMPVDLNFARRSVYCLLLGLQTLLFAMRVAGQAIQRWMPQPGLPPFEAFQGSALPYGVLLVAQLSILAVMVFYTMRIARCRLAPSHRAGVVLAWLGGIYMAIALTRVAIGLWVPDVASWFTVWIPALLHVVLASCVLTFAYYHVVESRPR